MYCLKEDIHFYLQLLQIILLTFACCVKRGGGEGGRDDDGERKKEEKNPQSTAPKNALCSYFSVLFQKNDPFLSKVYETYYCPCLGFFEVAIVYFRFNFMSTRVLFSKKLQG